ncbi:MAG: PsiF family protein [Steroidobacteraceae bacterium]
MSIRSLNHLRGARAAVATLAGILLCLPVAFADPPADKGSASASHGKGGKPTGAYDAADDGKDKGGKQKDGDHGQGKDGQQVSECNHRANDQKLKGQERKEYVEWCTDRGARDGYDSRRFQADRSCYRDADARGLDGDFRRVAIQDCLGREQQKQKRK